MLKRDPRAQSIRNLLNELCRKSASLYAAHGINAPGADEYKAIQELLADIESNPHCHEEDV